MADDWLTLKEALEEIEQTLSLSRGEAERLLIKALSTSVRSYGHAVLRSLSDRIPLWRWRGATLNVSKNEMRAGTGGPVFRGITINGDDFFHWLKNRLAASTLKRASAQQPHEGSTSAAALPVKARAKRRRPGPRTSPYEKSDRALFPKLEALMSSEGLSATGAALILAPHLKGGGTTESKATRLVRRYYQERQGRE